MNTLSDLLGEFVFFPIRKLRSRCMFPCRSPNGFRNVLLHSFYAFRNTEFFLKVLAFLGTLPVPIELCTHSEMDTIRNRTFRKLAGVTIIKFRLENYVGTAHTGV